MSARFPQLRARLARLRRAAEDPTEVIRKQGEKLKEMFSEYEILAKGTHELLKRASREKAAPKAEDREGVAHFSKTLKDSAAVLKMGLEEIESAQERLDSALTRISTSMYSVVRTMRGFPEIVASVKGISTPKPETLQELLEHCEKLGVVS